MHGPMNVKFDILVNEGAEINGKSGNIAMDKVILQSLTCTK